MINNELYDTLGERWYDADDDPVALLRAESRLKNPWIISEIKQRLGARSVTVVDIGCGAGFLANDLAEVGHQVTGVDLSQESLTVASRHDRTATVKYVQASAYELPFPDASVDVVSAMDFLEHVDRPAQVVAEAARILKPGGLFFFHTFNRNWLAHLVIIKAVEWLVKNTPRDMHVINLFIRPDELARYCAEAQMQVVDMRGIRPKVFKVSVLRALFTGVVPKDFSFQFCSSLKLSYAGIAQKMDTHEANTTCIKIST